MWFVRDRLTPPVMALLCAVTVAACSVGEQQHDVASTSSEKDRATGAGKKTESPTVSTSHPKGTARIWDKQKQIDEAKSFDPRFGKKSILLADEDGSGIDASKLFFVTSETLVISGPSLEARLRAASLGVVSHAPVLTYTGDNSSELTAEADRLKATTVLLVGDVDFPHASSLTVITDPMTVEATGDLTAQRFIYSTVAHPADATLRVVELDPKNPVMLVPVGAKSVPKPRTAVPDDFDEKGQTRPLKAKRIKKKVKAFPAQSARDGGASPVVVVSPASSIAAVATIKAYGASIRYLPVPDPRVSDATLAATVGIIHGPMVLVGKQFVSPEYFTSLVQAGEKTTKQLPEGGYLAGPDKLYVATRVRAGTSDDEVTKRIALARRRAENIAAESPLTVVPVLEIIPPAQFDQSAASMVKALSATVRAAGMHAVIMLPGSGGFAAGDEKLPADFISALSVAGVDVALDRRWGRVSRGEGKHEQFSNADAAFLARIGALARELEDITAAEFLPQKLLIVTNLPDGMTALDGSYFAPTAESVAAGRALFHVRVIAGDTVVVFTPTPVSGEPAPRDVVAAHPGARYIAYR